MTSTDIFTIIKTIIHITKTIIHITKNSIHIITKISIHITIKSILIITKTSIHKKKTNIQVDINKCSKVYAITISKREGRPKTFYKIRLAKRDFLTAYRKD